MNAAAAADGTQHPAPPRDAMAYNRRDDLGHWVNREKPTGELCEHACCRGYRQHPKGYPVIMPRRALRGQTDEQLQAYYRKVTHDPSSKARTAELQVMHELDRRDKAEEAARQRAELRGQRRHAAAANRAARQQEREAETERIKVAAEAGTAGYLVNASGRARGITDREILTGNETVFGRYASDEARDYFTANPRPTPAYFRGADTRYVERASEPRRRRRPPTTPRAPRRTRVLGWG